MNNKRKKCQLLFKILTVILLAIQLKAINIECILHMNTLPPFLFLISFHGSEYAQVNNDSFDLKNFNYLKKIGALSLLSPESNPHATYSDDWSIVTGKFEELYGIDEETINNPLQSSLIESLINKKLHEPVWISNQRVGTNRKSAAHWIGSNLLFDGQDILTNPFNNDAFTHTDLIDEYLTYFSDKYNPINFGALYFQESNTNLSLTKKLNEFDQTIGYLLNKTKLNSLDDKLNILISLSWSQHDNVNNFISNNNKTVLYLDKYIDLNLVHVSGSPTLLNVYIKNITDETDIYETLKKLKSIDLFKQEDLPVKNFSLWKNLGDLVIIAKPGFAILTTNDTSLNSSSINNKLVLGTGPLFKENYQQTRSFNTTDVYLLICFILNIDPNKNNDGSFRNLSDLLKEATNFVSIYILISLIPVITASSTAFALFILGKCKGSSGRTRIRSHNNNGYMMVSTSEADIAGELSNDEL